MIMSRKQFMLTPEQADYIANTAKTLGKSQGEILRLIVQACMEDGSTWKHKAPPRNPPDPASYDDCPEHEAPTPQAEFPPDDAAYDHEKPPIGDGEGALTEEL